MEWGLKGEGTRKGEGGGEGGPGAFFAEKSFSRKQILGAGLLLEGNMDLR